jgi:hypothetical protein
LLRAACAPFLPSAVRVLFARCAIVRFVFADAAAFLMFFRAALRCLRDIIMQMEWLYLLAMQQGSDPSQLNARGSVFLAAEV